MSRPRKMKDSQVVVIRIERTLYDKMRNMAVSMFGDNVSALIRKASEEFLNNHKQS